MDKKAKKQTLIVKLICLMLSFGLWMYIINVEHPIREYRLEKVPVEVINQDVLKGYNLALVPNQKLYVNLNLEGPINEIYKVKKDQFKVVVNLATYVLKKGENNIPVELVNSPPNISIKSDSFLKVSIILDEYSEKTLPIESKVKVSTSQGTYSDKVVVSPATATISGAQECLDRVKKLIVDGKVDNIDKDTDISLPIKAIDEGGEIVKDIKISPTTAKISLSVKKGKQVPIKVVVKGEPPEGVAIKSIVPDINKVELLGDEDVLSNINQVETEPVDISSLADNSEVAAILKVPNNTTLASGVNQIKVKITFSSKNIPNTEVPVQNKPEQATTTTTTKELEIPIVFKNIPDGYEVTSDVSKVKLKLSGLENDINAMKIEQIICNGDLTGMTEGEHTVKLNITNPYENVKIIEDNPKEINIKVVKKPIQ